jgi:hypothetical protein
MQMTGTCGYQILVLALFTSQRPNGQKTIAFRLEFSSRRQVKWRMKEGKESEWERW